MSNLLTILFFWAESFYALGESICFTVLIELYSFTVCWPSAEFLHVKPGKGAAFVRTKMRNYVTGNTVEKTFRAGVSVMPFILQIDLLLISVSW